MAELKLFIASSLDGYIAREDGSLDWLDEASQQLETENKNLEDGAEPLDGGYGKFIASIDVIIMGRKTYEEVLGFGVEWPYPDQHTYIATSDPDYKPTTVNTSVMNNIDEQAVESLKEESKKNIWVVGGGQLITRFLDLDAIDQMTITIISRILGKGIPLFPNNPKETKFELVSTETYGSGMVNLNYRKI